MKFMINGAVTLGTLDGANVEIHESVGDDNIILFGMTTSEVNALKHRGYNPQEYYNNSREIMDIINYIEREFSGKFHDIAESLRNKDPYMVLADFSDYSIAQQNASALYADPMHWNHMSLVNIAQAGRFAADRSIRDYANTIWEATPVEL